MDHSELMRAFEMFGQARRLEHGAAQVALLQEALDIAERADNPPLFFKWGVLFVEAAVFAGRADLGLPVFLKCFQLADTDPERFQADFVLWEYKWFANKLCRFPDVDRARIEHVLDDLAARFARAGWSPRAAFQLRMENAMAVGDSVVAHEAFQAWRKAPTGEGSDCPACECDRAVKYFVWSGKDAKALAVAKPILARELSCAEVPALTVPRLLKPMVRRSRADEALEWQERAAGLLAKEGDFLEPLADLIEFNALTGALPRAVKLFGAQLPKVLAIPDALNGFRILCAGHVLLHILERRNLPFAADLPPDVPVRPGPRSCAPVELDGWVTMEARKRATALDTRNGNTFYVDALRDSLRVIDEQWPQVTA